jgi:hypothetical protein
VQVVGGHKSSLIGRVDVTVKGERSESLRNPFMACFMAAAAFLAKLRVTFEPWRHTAVIIRW